MKLREIATSIACSMLAAALFAPVALAEGTTNTWWVAKEDPNAANTLDEGRGSETLPFRYLPDELRDRPGGFLADFLLFHQND